MRYIAGYSSIQLNTYVQIQLDTVGYSEIQ